ncbi:outer membrane beta-barrel protein [Pedobacter heparinus]|uniref:Outer membrane protein beta-barrel domain-containing protein n=1 Tax=Pedobacter heparinus (strain ATCC 13125 / DSM 2366 / CIP 104194 / JCM 7457 / NBRC 12017 / NCIMB 9290 / NRRL B-14731 / HIM 762-3) TaxID=485917 RepID=C6Y375_PEDHD|nr:outer membrane beta-barrel protein [Pedobacter heparinus]ACU05300.1 hypothetical protein Phep_3103 [Pedobacter heparinus DSM 2366]
MMKRLTLMIVLAFTGILSSNAQNTSTGSFRKFRIGLGLEGALPGKGLKDGYSIGAGLTLRAQYNVTPEIGITLASGAIAFIPKDIKNSDAKAALDIPVKLGGKYMITPVFYAMGEIGLSSLRVFYTDAEDKIQSTKGSSSFTYAPGVGLQLGGFDIGIRYEAFENAGFFGTRIGFNF